MVLGEIFFFFFSSRRRHTRLQGDWSSDVCSSDVGPRAHRRSPPRVAVPARPPHRRVLGARQPVHRPATVVPRPQTPTGLGFRMPAEWEPHAATWIGWPHNKSDWPGKFAPIPWVYGEIVRKLAPWETVRILVNSASHQAEARRVLTKCGVDLAQVEFLRFPTNRGWTRDFGPIFVRKGAELAIARFHFNAWAKYPDWKKDDKISERAARRLKLRLLQARMNGQPVVLEGGSIDVNGRGSLLTTEECLLHPTVQARNPHLHRAEVEQVLRDYLGATNVLWLGLGIAGDDTHGHVDDLCRFVGPRTVVLCREDDPHDANYRPLAENRERLQGMRLEDGPAIHAGGFP